jgi:glycosyltransferase involved in cell wall biosynthesis
VVAIVEGVDPKFAEPINSENPCIKELPQDVPYILCVAHSYPHKQVHLLVDAFSMVMDKIPHHLVLVGKPRRGEPRLQKSLDKLQDDFKVHRVSHLKYSQLQALYQNADLFVLPSVYEGFGLPILEAMLAGIPVITNNRASLPEVGGTHALYVQENSSEEFARNILDVINWDESFKREKIEKAMVWASSFTWRKSAEHTLRVLVSMVREKWQG